MVDIAVTYLPVDVWYLVPDRRPFPRLTNVILLEVKPVTVERPDLGQPSVSQFFPGSPTEGREVPVFTSYDCRNRPEGYNRSHELILYRTS